MRRFIAYICSALIIGGLGLGAIEMYNHEYKDATTLSEKIFKETAEIGYQTKENRTSRARLEEADRINFEKIQIDLNEACEKDAERLLGE